MTITGLIKRLETATKVLVDFEYTLVEDERGHVLTIYAISPKAKTFLTNFPFIPNSDGSVSMGANNLAFFQEAGYEMALMGKNRMN